MIKNIGLMAMAACLAGCGTTGAGFSKALENPVKFTESARAVATLAGDDGLKAKFLGLTGRKPANVKSLPEAVATDVCAASEGIFATDAALGAFADSLQIIKKVGEKPEDVSYTGYVGQFRKNSKYIDAAAQMSDPGAREAAIAKARVEELAARARCEAMFIADAKAKLVPGPDAPETASDRSLAAVLAFDVAIKTALNTAERVQREEAVRQTAVALMGGLNTAYLDLANTDLGTFRPRVEYVSLGADNPAATMNKTRLGATITLHRWYVAQQIVEMTSALAKCNVACLGDPSARKNLDDVLVAVREYRALSGIDTDDALAKIATGVKQAQQAADGKLTMAGLLDGLLTIADALSGLDKSVTGYQDARK